MVDFLFERRCNAGGIFALLNFGGYMATWFFLMSVAWALLNVILETLTTNMFHHLTRSWERKPNTEQKTKTFFSQEEKGEKTKLRKKKKFF